MVAVAGVPSADEGLVSEAPGLVPVSTEFSVPLRSDLEEKTDCYLCEDETCTITATHSHIKSNILYCIAMHVSENNKGYIWMKKKTTTSTLSPKGLLLFHVTPGSRHHPTPPHPTPPP